MRYVQIACMALSAACGVSEGVVTPKTAARLDVHRVEWNPRHEAFDGVVGVEDIGGDVIVFSRAGASIVVDGVIVNVDRNATHQGAIIPAPDGSGSWMTALDDRGAVWRLRARRSFESVSDRYGLEGKSVRSLAGFGGRYVAFALGDGSVAIADGANVSRYAARTGGENALALLTAGGLRAWSASTRDVAVLDPRAHVVQTYPLANAAAAVDGAGRAFVASGPALYEEKSDGSLVLRYVADDEIRSLAASNDRVWFADAAGELGVVGDGVARTNGTKLAKDTRLVGSLSGDVWTIDSHGALARFAVGGVATAARGSWDEVVAPIFARACATCHSPEGISGIDLSKPGAWKTKHDLLRQRVITDHDMPPAGHALADADRRALEMWMNAR